MTTTRRSFLQSAALGTIAAAASPSLLNAAASSEATPQKTAPISRRDLIDWHTHWIGPTVVKLLSQRKTGPRYHVDEQGRIFNVNASTGAVAPQPQAPIWFDVEARLKHLDEVGVERQLVSWVGASYDSALSAEESRPLWRAQNDDTAELVRKHPKRFLGLASLPTSDIPAAAAELERAHRDLGLIGATLPLDAFIHLESAQALAPIFAVAQKYRSHIYIHRGAAAASIPKQTPEVGDTNTYFGLPTTNQPNGPVPEVPGDYPAARTTLITSTHLAAGAITLALSNFLDPYPDVTVQHTMIGGSIVHLIEAVEQRAERAGQANPRERLRRIYLDTGATGRGPRGIALAAEVVGADRILFGSDYGPWLTIAPFIQGVADAGLTTSQQEQIYVGNGRALLKAKGLS